jgi:hypothetical protein
MRPAVQWWSNAPHCPTGYGVQTRTVVEYLARNGWDISVSANYGVQVVPVEHQVPDGPAIRVYPAGHDNYSQDVIAAHYHNYREECGPPNGAGDAVRHLGVEEPEPCEGGPHPVVDAGRSHADAACGARVGPSAERHPCRHDEGSGWASSRSVTWRPSTFRTLSSLLFKPSKGGGKLMQAPDNAFVVMMNAANKGAAPPRKAWSENFMAMSVFMKNHPDVFFYVHSEAKTPFGIDLVALQDALGMDKSRVMFPDQYAYRMSFYDDKALAKMYSRADVLLAVSSG